MRRQTGESKGASYIANQLEGVNTIKKRQRLNEAIAENIQQEIMDGQLKPGDRLPGEISYAKKYGVSRFTIREAMNRLCSIGLVDVRHGVGMFVSTPGAEAYVKPMVTFLPLTDRDVVTICEARLPIETQAIALCAKRASAEDIEQLVRIYDDMEAYLEKGDLDGYNELDLDFHLAIARASGNSIIYEILKALQSFLRAQMRNMLIEPTSKERSINRHMQMIEAIKQQDSDLASLIMSRHINDSIIYALGKKGETEKRNARDE